jgi:hypothetical protein
MIAPTMIRQYMEVLGSDGVHVGVVDQLEGGNAFRLVKDDPDAGGENHRIPLAWVRHVEMKVHLTRPGAEIRAQWTAH